MKRLFLTLFLITICSSAPPALSTEISFQWHSDGSFTGYVYESEERWAQVLTLVDGFFLADGYSGMTYREIMDFRRRVTQAYQAAGLKRPMWMYMARYWKLHAPIQDLAQ